MPKRIEILDALPVTPVGKIFKPALQQREIARVVRQEAAALGLADLAIEVVQDARRGLLAQISAGTHQVSLAQALGRYSFQIEWFDSPQETNRCPDRTPSANPLIRSIKPLADASIGQQALLRPKNTSNNNNKR